MDYIPVLGLKPSEAVLISTLRHFDTYLVSMAEPTTSRGWTLQDVFKHTKHMFRLKKEFNDKYNPDAKLIIDSGGYQIITGHITEKRIREFTDVYHMILEQFRDQIDLIFSLDINTPKFSKEMLKKYNDYSIDSSISLIKKYPEFSDKQLFIVQSRVPRVLNEWLELMDEHEIYKYYSRYSFGGLVGLKSETRVQFNHFVPMTLWLMTYLKTRGAELPKQIHMLGQSSRVALITGVILEKLTGINITMDSSEVVRFRPIESSIPMFHKKEDFTLVRNLEEMSDMLQYHSDPQAHAEIEQVREDLLEGKVSNGTFVELICQNISNLIKFSEHLTDSYDIHEIIKWNSNDFENAHEVLKVGRLSTELENNMKLIRTLMPYYENGDFDGIHSHVEKIIGNYYNGSKNKTGVINE
jgi:hypothetical protein